MAIQLKAGKVVLVDGKVANDPTCCCEGPCTFAISFEFKVSEDEYDADYYGAGLVQYGQTGINPLELSEGRLGWEVSTSGALFDIDSGHTVDEPGDYWDTWHTLTLVFTYHPELDIGFAKAWTVLAQVDALAADPILLNWPGPYDTYFHIGAEGFGGPALGNFRSIRNIAVTLAHESFNFPGDSFDELLGSAAIVGDELQISNADPDSQDVGSLDLNIHEQRCCFRECDEVSTVTVYAETSILVDEDDPATCSLEFSKTADPVVFTRIDHDETPDPLLNQFQMYFGDSGAQSPTICYLILGFTGPMANPYNQIHRTIENDSPACCEDPFPTCPEGTCTYFEGPGGTGSIAYYLITGADVYVYTQDGTNGQILISLVGQANASCLTEECVGPPACGCEFGGSDDSEPTYIEFTLNDVSNFLGSYTSTFTTDDCPDGQPGALPPRL